jgi:hypothetical protein
MIAGAGRSVSREGRVGAPLHDLPAGHQCRRPTIEADASALLPRVAVARVIIVTQSAQERMLIWHHPPAIGGAIGSEWSARHSEQGIVKCRFEKFSATTLPLAMAIVARAADAQTQPGWVARSPGAM